MPWCSECDRFYTQSTLNGDGTCPEGHQAADPPTPPPTPEVEVEAEEIEDDGRGAPWHFWLMVVVLVIYLGWRLVQGIMWAVGKL